MWNSVGGGRDTWADGLLHPSLHPFTISHPLHTYRPFHTLHNPLTIPFTEHLPFPPLQTNQEAEEMHFSVEEQVSAKAGLDDVEDDLVDMVRGKGGPTGREEGGGGRRREEGCCPVNRSCLS